METLKYPEEFIAKKDNLSERFLWSFSKVDYFVFESKFYEFRRS